MSIKIYNQIGQIAMNTTRPLKISELAKQLGIVKNGRNIHNYVRGAYNYYVKTGNLNLAGKISGVFINDNGNYAYQ
jgi:hypothetical protein